METTKATKDTETFIKLTHTMLRATTQGAAILYCDFLSKHEYFTKKHALEDGYFYRRTKDVEEELNMNYKKQRENLYILEKLNLITVRRKKGIHSWKYYKINTTLYQKIKSASPDFLKNLYKKSKEFAKEYRRTQKNGGKDTSPYGGKDTSPYGGKDTSPYGGKDTSPYGGKGISPYGGKGISPYGGKGISPYGGAPYNKINKYIKEEPISKDILKSETDVKASALTAFPARSEQGLSEGEQDCILPEQEENTNQGFHSGVVDKSQTHSEEFNKEQENMKDKECNPVHPEAENKFQANGDKDKVDSKASHSGVEDKSTAHSDKKSVHSGVKDASTTDGEKGKGIECWKPMPPVPKVRSYAEVDINELECGELDELTLQKVQAVNEMYLKTAEKRRIIEGMIAKAEKVRKEQPDLTGDAYLRSIGLGWRDEQGNYHLPEGCKYGDSVVVGAVEKIDPASLDAKARADIVDLAPLGRKREDFANVGEGDYSDEAICELINTKIGELIGIERALWVDKGITLEYSAAFSTYRGCETKVFHKLLEYLNELRSGSFILNHSFNEYKESYRPAAYGFRGKSGGEMLSMLFTEMHKYIVYRSDTPFELRRSGKMSVTAFVLNEDISHPSTIPSYLLSMSISEGNGYVDSLSRLNAFRRQITALGDEDITGDTVVEAMFPGLRTYDWTDNERAGLYQGIYQYLKFFKMNEKKFNPRNKVGLLFRACRLWRQEANYYDIKKYKRIPSLKSGMVQGLFKKYLDSLTQ